jgi:transposase
VEAQALAGAKKNAAAEGRLIMFIDESGLSERPQRVRTWAPRGQTPVLQYSFNWKLLSVIAGISYWQFYFRLYPGTICSAQIVEFLGHLRRQVGGKLLIIWDRLAAHRSRRVRDYVAATDGQIELEFLPAYAPELNPSEQIFNHGKNREMANFCPTDFQHLRRFARRSFRRMQRRPALIAAFWRQAELAF